MQAELNAEGSEGQIFLLGINAVGYELSNAGFVEGVSLPWLQDTDGEQVWETWNVVYRDVVILDPEGRLENVYNLTEHDLSLPENYEALKSLLLDP